MDVHNPEGDLPDSPQNEYSQSDRTGPESVRRGPWSPEEDRKLMEIITSYGPSNWVRISLSMKTRSPKQCRERYHQNLKPSLNRNPISYEEGIVIEQLVGKYGKKWAEIARHLKGRSDNAIKNWWNGGANRRRRETSFPGSAVPEGHTIASNYGAKGDGVLPGEVYGVGPSGNPEPVYPVHGGMGNSGHHGNYGSSTNVHHGIHVMAPAVPFQRPLHPAHPSEPRKDANPVYFAAPNAEIAPPPFAKVPMLPQVAFNTAIFNESRRPLYFHDDHEKNRSRSSDAGSSPSGYPPGMGAVPGFAGIPSAHHFSYSSSVSTSPSLYSAPPHPTGSYSEVSSVKTHDSWGSGSPCSHHGSVGYYDYHGRVPVSRSSTSSSQNSRRPSTAPDLQTPALPQIPMSQSSQPAAPHTAQVSHHSPLGAGPPEERKHGPAYAPSDHFVVPPFRHLVRSIHTQGSDQAEPAESLRVSRLIN